METRKEIFVGVVNSIELRKDDIVIVSDKKYSLQKLPSLNYKCYYRLVGHLALFDMPESLKITEIMTDANNEDETIKDKQKINYKYLIESETNSVTITFLSKMSMRKSEKGFLKRIK